MAHKISRPLITVVCNEETSATDLLGRYLLEGGETHWQDGPVTRAVRTGALLYLDEIAEARDDILSVIHPLTDHRRRLFIDRLNEELVAPNEFMMAVSFNPGYQMSLKEIKPSTRQRFVSVRFQYPDEEIETEIVHKETGIEISTAKRLVTLANRIRSATELGLRETVSTRLLASSGHLIVSGMNPRLACETGIVHCLSDDLQTEKALMEFVSLHF